MATESPASQTMSAEEKFAKKTLPRKAKETDVEELEKRVHVAELRAREAEAELRLIEASQKRKSLKTGNRERNKARRLDKKKGKKGGSDSDAE
jgi:hypothetical protein